uniref:Uncharacterized protein n=1 Tax=Lactuca sativa TaxID=4236 RepID=A0A9R1VFG7_LACSA|nr:hypothetical protein LSAT_V11C500271050 [Lactuca sativa]
MAEISTLYTSTFVMPDPWNFDIVGSILEALLEKVSLDNAIVRAYRKMPSSSVRPIPTKLQKIINEGEKPKRGEKRKAKTAHSEVIKVRMKTKKLVQKPRSPSPVLQEKSEERTESDIQGTSILRNEEDYTSLTSNPTHVETIQNVSSPPSSSIHTSDIFESII